MRVIKHLLFSLLLFIPLFVFAEDCDINEITITSLEQKSIEGETEVIAEPTFEGRNISFNLKMHTKGDSISYNVTINNTSDDDYMIDENTFKTDSDYIEYALETKDGNNVVKAKSSKEVVLSVTYKVEVDDSLFENGKYNAANELKLALNTNGKEKKMDIITTDNIKNPNTNNNGMKLIIIISIFSAIILILTLLNKTKLNKYVIFVFALTLMPVVHAICKVDIEVESKIEIEKTTNLNQIITSMANKDNSCVTKYEGDVTDEVGKTVPATKVYFDTCEERNVIFGGFCWQVIRTTETGGTKLIYNGEPVDGKCESSRNDHMGIVNNDGTHLTFETNYLYADHFDYDKNSRRFTLINPKTAEELGVPISKLEGKFTCFSEDNTCTTMYHINSFYDDNSTNTIAEKYTIDTISYDSIGNNQYNTNSSSLSMVGYMNNKKYNYKVDIIRNNTMFGSDFTYDETTDTYSLSGETQIIDNWYGKYYTISPTHYTCLNTTGTCNKISFIFLGNNNYAFYIELSNGKSIEDAINEMLYEENVNKNDSAMKIFVDTWYKHNMIDYTNKLEDTVYCNNRTIFALGGWNPNDGSIGGFLTFKSNSDDYYHNYDYNLVCENITDQFSVSNGKAKLTYPVALITREESYHMNKNTPDIYNNYFASISPANFHSTIVTISNAGGGYVSTTNSFNTRPVISLKNNSIIKTGTGSQTDPWIIKED